MEWMTENPKAKGEYLTTALNPLMYDIVEGPSSYAYQCEIGYFDGKKWDNSRTIAWMELPIPYVPKEINHLVSERR